MNISHSGRGCSSSCCLRVENVSVRIGSDQILSDINLHVHCGEMVALIGPNGAGKSTLLKTILGQQDYQGLIAFSQPGQRSQKLSQGTPEVYSICQAVSSGRIQVSPRASVT